MYGLRLATLHNLQFLLDLMKQIRSAILNDCLPDFRKEFYENYYGGRLPAGIKL